MNWTIKDVVGLVAIIFALYFVGFACAFARFNDGICDCGGKYVLVDVEYSRHMSHYLYQCSDCGIIEDFPMCMTP